MEAKYPFYSGVQNKKILCTAGTIDGKNAAMIRS